MVYQGNAKRGFWDKERNFGELRMLVTSELAEALEAHRKNRTCKAIMPVGDFKEWFEANFKDTVEDEIADAVIRLFDLCGGLGTEKRTKHNTEMKTTIRKELEALPYPYNKLALANEKYRLIYNWDEEREKDGCEVHDGFEWYKTLQGYDFWGNVDNWYRAKHDGHDLPPLPYVKTQWILDIGEPIPQPKPEIQQVTGHKEAVNHPSHYGGKDNPYEAIKVIEAWDLNFHLGNAIKYIARAGKKGDKKEDLKKALWYIQRELDKLA
jgi:NTP pyrophosphatase (non-canonical NTP hydrolase)